MKKARAMSIVALALALASHLGGCTTGPMQLSERYMVGTSNGHDRVYYRVTITGDTKIGVSEFRQGWYPAEAVDQLFGDVSAENTDARAVREELRQQIDQSLIEARRAYLAEAIKPDADEKKLAQLLEAVRRTRQSPLDVQARKSDASTPDKPARSVETTAMEYNPAEDLVTRHAGQKLVMVLSSNPDEVMNKLSELSGDADTQAMFSKFANIMARDQRKQHADDVARTAVNGAVGTATGKELESFAKLVATQKNREVLLGRIDALLSVLRATEP